MRVLVAVATKHGATREIAEAVGRTLAGRGLDAEVADAEDAAPPDGYDAVVLGSAVYAGRWLEPARRYAEEHGPSIAAAGTPAWLFSSGPVGDPPRPAADDAVESAPLVEATAARDHRVFAGKLDRSVLSFAERAVALAFRAEDGDFRDWAEIEAWAGEIADALAR